MNALSELISNRRKLVREVACLTAEMGCLFTRYLISLTLLQKFTPPPHFKILDPPLPRYASLAFRTLS